jgi:hypothetical protein
VQLIVSAMNYRRLQNGYRCQRNRGKSHYQITLELFAKLMHQSKVSSGLMKLSLERHGLRTDIGRSEKVSRRSVSDENYLDRNSIFNGPFFLDPTDEGVWNAYRQAFGGKIDTVVEDAETICRHQFDLLGSGLIYLGHPIDWQIDPVSGYRWPKKLFSELKEAERSPRGTDIKFPWELSRMQHLPTLGKAYRLTRDERFAREVVEQLTQWLDDNPCPYGVNWACPMDVAIRIMNIVWGYLLIKDATVMPPEFRSRLAVSIFQHGQYVLFNLEYGLRDNGSIINGNHYLTNIVGLLHLGLLCPEIKAAQRWKTFAAKALIDEMEREVHPDGVNFESSIAYHRLVLELFTAGALLCRNSGLFLPEDFWHRLERMYEFVFSVTRPDGTVPVVGDADDGRLYILSDYRNWHRTDFRYLLSIGSVLFRRSDMKAKAGPFAEEAFWLLGPSAMNTFSDLEQEHREIGSRGFLDAGLYVMRQANNYLLACCGSIGAKKPGSHKHNDLLSFELYAGDKPLIVDPGAYVYTRDPEWRNLFRSTRYHNTLVIDRQEQNRFDSKRIFNMTPDAPVTVHEWLSTDDMDRLDVEHTGYTRLDPPVSHRRTFQFNKIEGTWEIVDLLFGAGQHTADWYFHFDSGIALVGTAQGRFQTRCEGTNLEIVASSENSLDFGIDDGWISRRYGHKQPAKILRIGGRFTSECRVRFTMRTV